MTKDEIVLNARQLLAVALVEQREASEAELQAWRFWLEVETLEARMVWRSAVAHRTWCVLGLREAQARLDDADSASTQTSC